MSVRHPVQVQLTEVGHRALKLGAGRLGMAQGEYIEWLIVAAVPDDWEAVRALMDDEVRWGKG